VMGINVQIALCAYLQINETVADDLIEHVIQEGDASGELALS